VDVTHCRLSGCNELKDGKVHKALFFRFTEQPLPAQKPFRDAFAGRIRAAVALFEIRNESSVNSKR